MNSRPLFIRLAAFLPLVATTLLHGQAAPAAGSTPTAHQIVANMQARNRERAAALREYTAKRNYDLDYRGFPSNKHAAMTVSMRLVSPGNKDLEVVSESGSGLLRNRVLRPLLDSEREASHNGQNETALNEDNYDFALAGEEQKDSRECFVVDVTPKRKNKFLYVGRVWIDKTDYAVVHISAHPAKNPSFWITRVQIEHEYGKFGELWLPIRNRSDSSTRFGGRAVLTIDYGNPQFNSKDSGLKPVELRGAGNDN